MVTPADSWSVRALRRTDAEPLADGFAAIGWRKPAALFLRYMDEQESSRRSWWVASVDDDLAGYVTLRWAAWCPRAHRGRAATPSTGRLSGSMASAATCRMDAG